MPGFLNQLDDPVKLFLKKLYEAVKTEKGGIIRKGRRAPGPSG
jgi:hypothetical protein